MTAPPVSRGIPGGGKGGGKLRRSSSGGRCRCQRLDHHRDGSWSSRQSLLPRPADAAGRGWNRHGTVSVQQRPQSCRKRPSAAHKDGL